MNYLEKLQKEKIKKNQKLLLALLHIHVGKFYPLRKWLGIDYRGKIDEITDSSIAYNTTYSEKDETITQTRTYQQPDLGCKLNVLLDKLPQLALVIPAILEPAYSFLWLVAFGLTQSIYQPTTKDTYLIQHFPTSADGTATWLWIDDNTGYANRTLLEFDISDIPSGATLTQGDLGLYYYSYQYTDPSGVATWVYKLTRTNWVESGETGCCWNNYSGTTAWTTAGGDYVTSNPSGATTNMPASYGWVTWGIKDIVADAYTNSNSVECILKYANDAVAAEHRSIFYSKRYNTDTSLRPKLTVTYTISNSSSAFFSFFN